MKRYSRTNHALMHNLMASVLCFMVRAGVDRNEIEDGMRSCLAILLKEGGAKDRLLTSAPCPGDDTVAADVMRAWHHERRYLSRAAEPVALKLYGPHPSVESLVRSQDVAADPLEIIRGLLTTGLIRRAARNRYLPTAESATISQLHPLLIEHVAKSVMRLVETVYRNTDATQAAVPLIERFSHVPDLDPEEAQAFAEFSRQQGLAFLESMDEWLELRRMRNDRGPRRSKRTQVTAGVHLIAYVGDQEAGSLRPGPARHAAESSRRLSLAAPS